MRSRGTDPSNAGRPRLGLPWVAVGVGCLSTLAQMPRICGADWFDQRTVGPFACRSEFSLTEIEPLLAELGQLQVDLVEALKVPAAQEEIDLYLFRDKASYGQFLSRNLPKATYRRALYVKDGGPGRVFAYRSAQFETDVRHECTHALLHAVLRMVPLWLDEGLAGYFEQPADKRAFDSPQLGAVRWAIRLGGIRRLEGLEQKKKVEEMDRCDYRAAWAWVHFMLHGPPEAGAELVQFLADIRSGGLPGLLSQRLQSRLSDPMGRFNAHFQSWSRQKRDEAPRTGQTFGAAGRVTY